MSLDASQIAIVASWLLGWLYFLAWTTSFFPQAILNHRRNTTEGLMPDFPLLNVFGFGCYTFSTAVFLFSPLIREQYGARHPLSPDPTNRVNDLAFGVLGFTMSVLTYSQFWPRLWGWEQMPGVTRHATKVTLGLISGSILALAVSVLVVCLKGEPANPRAWAWIDVVYCTEYIKLVMTVFKYIPQAVANFRRKSTIGWSISQQLLDFTGGLGSLAQLILDSSLQSDWSGLFGNPLKLGLANISLAFDIIFILQHFVFFGPVEEKALEEDPQQPLLPDRERR
ncbi:hypothetical protein DOTSEDRAFT_68408 [Dothistroma septosporum NZE10]|uniref:Uncharacterized protein n=1 Tax=Dothistroma septosporum (strain NZE10 / CBS 128990) TaxID=675120 RepID=N1Q1Q2_DOTSN|nr:hypothetical protein DOTSEDRAFT_68408 [Dothistroma septosporum NZE10]